MENEYSYDIYVDASIDIDNRYLIDNDIHFIPMKYIIDDREYLMDRQQTADELKYFYNKMQEGSITGTSQITPYTYEQFFRAAAEEGRNVLYLCLSSGLSSTYESSLNAAQAVMDDYPDIKIECVDTKGATGGMGLLMLLAIRLRKEGKTNSENAAVLRDRALDVCYWFMVEDLVYLKRGGRVSATAAFAGNVRAHDDTIGNEVVISHADCRERAEKLAEDVRRINPNADVQISSMGTVIGAHTGPGFTAIIHYGNRNYH